jgi:hypothetical protein
MPASPTKVQSLLSDMRENLEYIQAHLSELSAGDGHRGEVKAFCELLDARLGDAQALWGDFTRNFEEAPKFDGELAKNKLISLHDLLADQMAGLDALVMKFQKLADGNKDLVGLSVLLNESAANILKDYMKIRDDFALFTKLIVG